MKSILSPRDRHLRCLSAAILRGVAGAGRQEGYPTEGRLKKPKGHGTHLTQEGNAGRLQEVRVRRAMRLSPG